MKSTMLSLSLTSLCFVVFMFAIEGALCAPLINTATGVSHLQGNSVKRLSERDVVDPDCEDCELSSSDLPDVKVTEPVMFDLTEAPPKISTTTDANLKAPLSLEPVEPSDPTTTTRAPDDEDVLVEEQSGVDVRKEVEGFLNKVVHALESMQWWQVLLIGVGATLALIAILKCFMLCCCKCCG